MVYICNVHICCVMGMLGGCGVGVMLICGCNRVALDHYSHRSIADCDVTIYCCVFGMLFCLKMEVEVSEQRTWCARLCYLTREFRKGTL